jgi:hypothetical protein
VIDFGKETLDIGSPEWPCFPRGILGPLGGFIKLVKVYSFYIFYGVY